MTDITGLLWFDNGPDPLEEKIRRAAARYRAKHGEWPTTCYVPREAVPVGPVQVEANGPAIRTVQVVPVGFVLRHHLLLAGENKKEG
jgi:hypothetical protein